MSQYRNKGDDKDIQDRKDHSIGKKTEQTSEFSTIETKKLEPVADYFEDAARAKRAYVQISDEYNSRIVPSFNLITREKDHFPPFWDSKKEKPVKLPLHQHNVSSGRYLHTLSQYELSYNSFFPSQSNHSQLVDVEILESPFGDEDQKEECSASREASKYIERGLDNLLRFNCWSKQEHLHMVSQMLNYGIGIYQFDDDNDYKWSSLDYTKCRFPIGTSVDPAKWEYMFISHKKSVSELLNRYEKAGKKSTTGWLKKPLKQVLSDYIAVSDGSGTHRDTATENIQLETLQDLREGVNRCSASSVCSNQIEVVSLFWKDLNGKVSEVVFVSGQHGGKDVFIYKKETGKTFDELFSTFPFDHREREIRLVKGLGKKIFALCNAYERTFSRFLDATQHASTLFLDMEEDNFHKKILYMGSINIGKFSSIQKFPDSLSSLISSLAFFDAKIEQMTATRGLNKTEMLGDNKKEELSNTLLTTEGRIKKHETDRFVEKYTEHFKKVIARILKIANSKSLKKRYSEIDVKFYEYLKTRGIDMDLIKGDDTSDMNQGLPSNWLVQARKPSGMGIRPSASHTIKQLNPILSSLPEEAYRQVLAMIVSDAFNDEDMAGKIFGDPKHKSASTEYSEMFAEMQVDQLTDEKSDFDFDVDFSADVVPELADASKFTTFNSYKFMDSFVFLDIIFAKVEDAKQRLSNQEIGITTAHIWLYNLLSTAQRHVQSLQGDEVRSKRPDAKKYFELFGKEFNNLRFIESQANKARQKRIEEIKTKLQQQELDDPKRIEAQAKLITAQAAAAKVENDKSVARLEVPLKINKDRRAEEAGQIDSAVKLESIKNMRSDRTEKVNQSNVGRPASNEQRGTVGIQ